MTALRVHFCVYRKVGCNSLFPRVRSRVLVRGQTMTGAVMTCEHFLAEGKTWGVTHKQKTVWPTYEVNIDSRKKKEGEKRQTNNKTPQQSPIKTSSCHLQKRLEMWCARKMSDICTNSAVGSVCPNEWHFCPSSEFNSLQTSWSEVHSCFVFPWSCTMPNNCFHLTVSTICAHPG